MRSAVETHENYKAFMTDCKRICRTEELHDQFDLKKVDSLARAELILAVEENFCMELTNEEIAKMKEFGDIRGAVSEHLSREAQGYL